MIKSHFQHRGYDVRLRGYGSHNITYIIRTPWGPDFGGADSVMQARRLAIARIDTVYGDWVSRLGSEVGYATSSIDTGTKIAAINRS